MAITGEMLQNVDVSQAIIGEFRDCEAFQKASGAEGERLRERDQKDNLAIAQGLRSAHERGELDLPPADPREPTPVDTGSKNLHEVAEEIQAVIRDSIPDDQGYVVALGGDSGTGKSSTVRVLQEKLPSAQVWSLRVAKGASNASSLPSLPRLALPRFASLCLALVTQSHALLSLSLSLSVCCFWLLNVNVYGVEIVDSLDVAIVASQGNGNVIRSITHLAVEKAKNNNCEVEEVLSTHAERRAFFDNLTLEKGPGDKYELFMKDKPLKEIQNSVLKSQEVEKKLTTVSEKIQGEHFAFMHQKLEMMKDDGACVSLGMRGAREAESSGTRRKLSSTVQTPGFALGVLVFRLRLLEGRQPTLRMSVLIFALSW